MNPHQDIRFSHIKTPKRNYYKSKSNPWNPKNQARQPKPRPTTKPQQPANLGGKNLTTWKKLVTEWILKNHHPNPWNKSSNVSNFSIKAKNAPKQILAFLSNYHLQNQLSYTQKA